MTRSPVTRLRGRARRDVSEGNRCSRVGAFWPSARARIPFREPRCQRSRARLPRFGLEEARRRRSAPRLRRRSRWNPRRGADHSFERRRRGHAICCARGHIRFSDHCLRRRIDSTELRADALRERFLGAARGYAQRLRKCDQFILAPIPRVELSNGEAGSRRRPGALSVGHVCQTIHPISR